MRTNDSRRNLHPYLRGCGIVPEVRKRRALASKVVFHPWTWPLFLRATPYLKRAHDLILNNDLTPSTNGEDWLADELPAEGTFIDVGFHKGDWTRRILEPRPHAEVIAFDPWPPAAGYYAQMGDRARVNFRPVGVGESDGIMKFNDYDNACNSFGLRDLELGSDSVRSYEVEVVTLDAWCASNGITRVRCLKVDAEGFDLAVLKGAPTLLSRQLIDVCIFEYSTAWISTRAFLGEAVQYLTKYQYRVFKLYNGFIAPYTYSVRDETFAGAMFVALSPSVAESQLFRRRRLNG